VAESKLNTETIIKSKNYIFHVDTASLAYQNINQIIDLQEQVFSIITSAYNFTPNIVINYHLLETPKECGLVFNKLLVENGCNAIQNYQTNAFAWFPDMIYATYNSDIKAIGYHEDSHIITYSYFKSRSVQFVEEGISVSFDDYWLGLPLHSCSKYILYNTNKINLNKLIEDQYFNSINGLISYPVAGSFCKWVKSIYGMERIKEMYIKSNEDNKYIKKSGLLAEYFTFINEITINKEESVKIVNKLIL
jgi:hypothetical protein